jgi:predicted signal transduction protein with EAL and GGDEF domain
VEGQFLNIGAHVGIALFPSDGTDCDQVLKNAKLALSRAQEGAGGIYRFYEIGMDEQIRARRELEIDLRRALTLREFKIKIDQSFVRGSPDDPSGMAIVNAIAALGRSLGISTTAEGVETDEQLNRVSAGGCTDVQGYLIGKPLAPERISEFLQSRGEEGVVTRAAT